MASDFDGSPRPTGLDGFFGRTNLILLILLSICCAPVGVVLGLVGVLTCITPQAKQNSLIVLIISLLFGGLGTLLNCAGVVHWR
jgi:hypothetical protein